MNKLKPCPFCNGEASIGKVKYSDNCEEVKLNNRSVGYFGHCVQCSATMQQGLSYETEEIAINKWNKQFAINSYENLELLKQGSIKFQCDKCHEWLTVTVQEIIGSDIKLEQALNEAGEAK